MERRKFLQLLLAAGASVCLPAALNEKNVLDGDLITGELGQFEGVRWIEWDAKAEHGMAINYYPAELKIPKVQQNNKIRDFLISEARNTLPKGTRFQIRKSFPWQYGRRQGIAWYYHPSMMKEPKWHSFRKIADDKSWDPSSGIWIIGQGTA